MYQAMLITDKDYSIVLVSNEHFVICTAEYISCVIVVLSACRIITAASTKISPEY
jgi:hypothetical protein